MKFKIFLPVLIIGLVMSSLVKAQDVSKYGDDPEACAIKLSTYTEFFRQDNYKDAMNSWRWCFINCPEATKNIYIHGTTIIEYFIDNATDDTVREAYVDTLLMVYDNRIKYFGQEGVLLGRKGLAMLKYRSNDVQAAYEVFERSFELLENSTEYFALKYYMNTAAFLFGGDFLTKEKIVEIFSKVSTAINFQIDNESNEKKKETYISTAEEIKQLFVNSGAADCAAIINVFEPQFNADPQNVELAKEIVDLLDSGTGDDCKLADLYMNAAVLVYNTEKSSSSAHSIAQGYFKRNDSGNAEKYYLEAINLEKDDSKKADMYYELGLLYYNLVKNYPAARSAARGALAIDPNYGKAYMLIGRVYAATGGCGETAFEKKSINWLIVDQFIKAKNVSSDADVAKDANELIGRYSSRFPTLEEVFWLNLSEGQTVTIGCWINETTTIRCTQ
ncbi:MAG: tetratricopeptide repeat protein [Bacteroidales bacterium]|nr:tetratricopeptide repeat protein [Bacteroidales bacterium]